MDDVLAGMADDGPIISDSPHEDWQGNRTRINNIMDIDSDDEKSSHDGDGMKDTVQPPNPVDEEFPSPSPIRSRALRVDLETVEDIESQRSPSLTKATSPFFRKRSSMSPGLAAIDDDDGVGAKLYEWREVEHIGENPPPMSGLTSVRYERTMYVFGGYNNGEALDGLYSFDLDTCVWSKVRTVGPSPTARTSHSTVVDHASGKMYVSCGSGSRFGHSNLGDWYELDLRLKFWRKLEFTGDEMLPRYGQTVVCYDHKLFMFGGTFGREFSKEFFMIDIEKARCTKIRGAGTTPSPRYKHSAGIFNRNKMLVFGGAELQNYKLNDAYFVNLDTMRWNVLKCGGDVPRGRFAHSMVVHNDKAYLFGGTDRTSCRSDLYMLDIATRTWTCIDCSGSIPRGRYFHGTIFDDRRGEMLIWGGKGSTTAQIRFNDLHAIPLSSSALSHPLYKCSLSRDLLNLLSSEDFADLKLIGRDRQSLRAHQLIVRARCPRLMMRVRYDKSSPLGMEMVNDDNEHELSIEDLTDDHMAVVALPYDVTPLRLLLKFLYSGELEISRDIDFKEYLELMFCAAELALQRLQALCEKRLRDMIDIERAIMCLGRMKDHETRLDSLERFLLKYTHVQLAHTHGPGVPMETEQAGEPTVPSEMVDEEDTSLSTVLSPIANRNRSPTRFACEPIQIPASTLHMDLLRLREMTPEKAELESIPYDLRIQFGNSRSRVFAHQVLLAGRTTYFGSYSFRQGMLEAQSGVCMFPGAGEAVLSRESFESLLDYIYGGEIVLHSIPVRQYAEFLNADACNYFGLSSKQLDRFARQQLRRANKAENSKRKAGGGCLIS